jgi:hypothetical protein
MKRYLLRHEWGVGDAAGDLKLIFAAVASHPLLTCR